MQRNGYFLFPHSHKRAEDPFLLKSRLFVNNGAKITFFHGTARICVEHFSHSPSARSFIPPGRGYAYSAAGGARCCRFPEKAQGESANRGSAFPGKRQGFLALAFPPLHESHGWFDITENRIGVFYYIIILLVLIILLGYLFALVSSFIHKKSNKLAYIEI